MRKVFLSVVACFCLLSTLYSQNVHVSPTEVTPLVGRSCVINQIDKNLVDVVGVESSLGNLIDTNIDNYASLSGLAGVDVAYHQIVSIKDIEHTYAADLEAGFVLQSTSEGSNLLTVDVLKLFVVETYLNDEKQESSVYQDGEGGLLDLNLITITSDGKTKVSIRTTKPFNELRLAVAGVNVEAFKQLKLYYAYVGENPIHPITQTTYYPSASVRGHRLNGVGDEWTTAIWNWPKEKEKLVGVNSEEEGVGFGTLSSLLTEPRVTIHAGEEIPANTEIGFVIESGSVLAINLLKNTILTTYDAEDNEVESKKIISVLGLSAVSGKRTSVSMITTKPCYQIKIQFGGLNIDLGGTKIFYAYTRETKADIKKECDLKLSADVAVCFQDSYQLSGVEGITWSIESQPEGTNATVSSTGLVENMTKKGEYVIKAEKGDCVDYVIINNSPIGISNDCNRPIVGENIVPFAPSGGGCLLCISPDLDDNSNNVVDMDLDNYIEYTKGLDLLSNTSIYGVEKVGGMIYNATPDDPRRVGFVMQATDQFLSADVLKFFVIKTYLNGELQESSPVDENDAVSAGLLGGLDKRMRFSFVATKPFNQVTIWTAGVLSLNLSKYRIYYAFEEPATSTCLNQYSTGACLTMLSNIQHGATINYDRTGLGGVANVGATMRNLSYVIDDDMNSSGYIGKVAGVAANMSLSIKTNRVFEHGCQAGFVVKEQTYVGNVDLLRGLRIRTYLNGVATGDENIIPEVLALDLIGGAGKSLVTIVPTKPFNEIQLDMGGLVDALVELNVYGAFVQSDTDGDGTPDCLDKSPCGVHLEVEAYSTCGSNQVEIVMSGGEPSTQYTLWDGEKEYDFVDGRVSFDAVPGHYNCTIRENGEDVYSDIIFEVHSSYTEWTGAVSSDWNDWRNWSEGVPGECTNVLIPSIDSLETTNGIHYPILEEGKGFYICNGIYFKPGAELVRQDLLTYNKAWVALNIYPEKVNMVNVPLKETFSGDFFVYSKSEKGETLVQDRKNPLLGDVLMGNVNRATPFAVTSVWNDGWNQIRTVLDRKFGGAEGFSVNTLKNSFVDSSTPLEFIFGKEDTLYHKVNNVGTELAATVSIPRVDKEIGRFVYESEMLQATLSGKTEQTAYLVGNPFISHLNVSAFLMNEHNASVLKSFVRINDDLANNPNADYNQLAIINSDDVSAKVPPTQSFFVEPLVPATELTVEFTKAMMVHGDYSVAEPALPKARSAETNEAGISLADIKAYAKNGEAVISSSETITKVEVVTIAGQVLLAKRLNSTECRMALGEGVNIVKVTTGNGTQNFKLVK